MKYIKLFENYSDGFSEYKYSGVENDKRFTIGKLEDFTKEEIDQISKTGNVKLSYVGDTIFYFEIIKISKFKDEWYLVSVYGGYNENYECGQFDGLINCLNYLKNKLGK